MKNILLGTVALSALLAASCTKQNTPPVTGTWTMAGTTHTVEKEQSFTSGAQAFMAKDVNGNSIYFYFQSLPTANGVYRVVHNQNPLANQVFVTTQTIGQTAHQSIGDDSTDAMVTIADGRVNISVPNIWMGNVNMLINDSTWKPTDSTILSATSSFAIQYVQGPSSIGGSGFWNIGAFTGRAITSVARQDMGDTSKVDSTLITVKDANTGTFNSVLLWFKKFPTASGVYKTTAGALKNDNDIRIVATLYWNPVYMAMTEGRPVNVTVFQDGSVGISIPHTWLKNVGNPQDSLIFSGVIMKK